MICHKPAGHMRNSIIRGAVFESGRRVSLSCGTLQLLMTSKDHCLVISIFAKVDHTVLHLISRGVYSLPAHIRKRACLQVDSPDRCES